MNPWQKFYKPKGLKERFKNKNRKKATKQKKKQTNKQTKTKQKQGGREERELLGLLSLDVRGSFVSLPTLNTSISW